MSKNQCRHTQLDTHAQQVLRDQACFHPITTLPQQSASLHLQLPTVHSFNHRTFICSLSKLRLAAVLVVQQARNDAVDGLRGLVRDVR